MRQLARLKLANAIKVGMSGEESGYFAHDKYDIYLDNWEFTITNKNTQKSAHTSVFNAVSWHDLEQSQKGSNEPKPSAGGTPPTGRNRSTGKA